MYVKLCVLITYFLHVLNLVAVLCILQLKHAKYVELHMCMFVITDHVVDLSSKSVS